MRLEHFEKHLFQRDCDEIDISFGNLDSDYLLISIMMESEVSDGSNTLLPFYSC